jgi:hypothetical protein
MIALNSDDIRNVELAVVAFYFGSSSGSEAKTKIIGDIAKEP